MRKLANRILGKLGYRVVRVPRRSPVNVPRPEIADIETILGEFANSQSRDSDLSSFESLRAYLSDQRIQLFYEILQTSRRCGVLFDGKSIADVGCGTGFLLRLLAESAKAPRLFGFDTNVKMNVLARMLCSEAEIRNVGIGGVDEKFDIVFCTEVLEHLVDPSTALLSMIDRTKAGGSLILTVPDGRLDQGAAGKIREDGTAYWGHVHFWSPESWRLFINSVIDTNIDCQFGELTSQKNFTVLTRAQRDPDTSLAGQP